MKKIIAVDLGAESGRVIVATFDKSRVELDLVHRFENHPKTSDGGLRWDVQTIFNNIKNGLREAGKRHGGDFASIGVCTWGVDYALVDAKGELVEAPYHYRHPRTIGIPEEVHRIVPEEELYRRTGITSMIIDTSYQLYAHKKNSPESLDKAARWLGIPDLLHFWLSGEMANEQTFASTTQLAKAGAKEWDRELIGKLGLPDRLFTTIAPAGTKLGRLKSGLAAELGFKNPPAIVLPGSHDTASAVAAMPGDPAANCYISSGTWSLMGMFTKSPIATEECRALSISNEVAADGQCRPLKNIMGLWIVQECKRAFAAAGREYTYDALAELATNAKPSAKPLDVDDQRFFHASIDTDAMPNRILAWCTEKNVAAPADDGAMVRMVLEGLADAYRRCLGSLEKLAKRSFSGIHVLGGGSNNKLLCQLTADACGKPLFAGPAEATALGNVMVQAQGLGLVKNAAEIRSMLVRSVDVEDYGPRREAVKRS
jgi:rhamnulokinase